MSAAVKWTLAIVGLLVGNILAMAILAVVASSTAPAVVPEYYDRAAHYNDTIDEAARSHALGWASTVTLRGASVEVTVRDRSGAPVERALVTIAGYPRAHATRTIDTTLVAASPGVYRASLPMTAVGVHDVTVVVDRDGERFVATATVEAR